MRLKEQYINGNNDNDKITEINKRANCDKKTNKVTREQVLSWTNRVKVQRAQKTILDVTKDNNLHMTTTYTTQEI